MFHFTEEPAMKFITVRDIRTSPAQIWKQLPEEQEMVITNNGRPIALLTPITDQSLEQTLSAVRRARAMAAVQNMQKRARDIGLDQMADDEIDEEIRAARRERKR
jgi:antitoxin (DNA-binding transcriptional repressor) of toxin-antitoxin stability system